MEKKKKKFSIPYNYDKQNLVCDSQCGQCDINDEKIFFHARS